MVPGPAPSVSPTRNLLEGRSFDCIPDLWCSLYLPRQLCESVWRRVHSRQGVQKTQDRKELGLFKEVISRLLWPEQSEGESDRK